MYILGEKKQNNARNMALVVFFFSSFGEYILVGLMIDRHDSSIPFG